MNRYEFRELECDDARGMGWISRDGIDVAHTGAQELLREDNLRIAKLFVDAGNGAAAAVARDALYALKLILDQVDYTSGACGLNEPVGAALPKTVIGMARAVISSVMNAEG